MGGNVEAYYEAQRERKAEDNRLNDLVHAYGQDTLKDNQFLVLQVSKPRSEIIIADKHSVKFHSRHMRHDEAAELLKMVGYKVRIVKVEE